MTAAEAIDRLDNLKMCFPFEIATKFGPRLLMKADISPELAAELLPHAAEFRRKGYTLRQDEKNGKWTASLFVRLVYTASPEPIPPEAVSITSVPR
jgi:hypothetical protein